MIFVPAVRKQVHEYSLKRMTEYTEHIQNLLMLGLILDHILPRDPVIIGTYRSLYDLWDGLVAMLQIHGPRETTLYVLMSLTRDDLVSMKDDRVAIGHIKKLVEEISALIEQDCLHDLRAMVNQIWEHNDIPEPTRPQTPAYFEEGPVAPVWGYEEPAVTMPAENPVATTGPYVEALVALYLVDPCPADTW